MSSVTENGWCFLLRALLRCLGSKQSRMSPNSFVGDKTRLLTQDKTRLLTQSVGSSIGFMIPRPVSLFNSFCNFGFSANGTLLDGKKREAKMALFLKLESSGPDKYDVQWPWSVSLFFSIYFCHRFAPKCLLSNYNFRYFCWKAKFLVCNILGLLWLLYQVYYL